MNSSIESSGTLSVPKAKYLHKSLRDQNLRQKSIILVAQTPNFRSIMLVLFDPVVTLELSYLFTVRPPRTQHNFHVLLLDAMEEGMCTMSKSTLVFYT